MIAALIFAAVHHSLAPDIQQFARGLEQSRAGDDLAGIVATFLDPKNASYLREFARSRKGIKNTQLVVIPAPPGWENTGKYWAIFHAPNNLQSEHDVVIGVTPKAKGWNLDQEVRERTPQGVRITNADTSVTILPAAGSASIQTSLTFANSEGQPKATVLRINDFYTVEKARAPKSYDVQIAQGLLAEPPKVGTVLQAGGLVIVWQPRPPAALSLEYSGKPGELTEDRVNASSAYLTGWWVPSLGRLPHTSSVTITGPSKWTFESEGDRVKTTATGNLQTTQFRCKVPISYPKVVGGLYKAMGQTSVEGVSMTVFHGGEGDPERAKLELKLLEDSMKFYLDTFGSFPFDHYNLYDSDTFYGIESYSYTILQKRITKWAISHEMGHSYFGGVVPCSHTSDSWNEGMTQFVDSVWFKNNSDRSLNSGFASTRIQVPLTDVDSPWADGSISYMRGAYVLHLLEQEIGRETMLKALKALIKDRVGKDTTWRSLRPYFEKASGQDLSWFWRQWFEAATFPTLAIGSAMTSPSQEEYLAKAVVTITPPIPNSRCRFAIRWTAPGHEAVTKHSTTIATQTQTMTIEDKLSFRPVRADIVAYPYTLATTGAAAEVGFTLVMPSPWINAMVSPTISNH